MTFLTLQQSTWGKYLVTFVISMLPILELRGAIPVGVGAGLGVWTSMLISVVGNMVPVPFIILFIRRIFVWLRTNRSWKTQLLSWSKRPRASGKRFGNMSFSVLPFLWQFHFRVPVRGQVRLLRLLWTSGSNAPFLQFSRRAGGRLPCNRYNLRFYRLRK